MAQRITKSTILTAALTALTLLTCGKGGDGDIEVSVVISEIPGSRLDSDYAYVAVRYSATGTKIEEVGVMYSTTRGSLHVGAFDTHDGKNTADFGIVSGLPSVSGTFGADLKNLRHTTTYYVIPYLKLDKATGDFYKGYFLPTGGYQQFTTLVDNASDDYPPNVSECSATNVEYNTATLNAEVVSAGRPGFIDKGFCYSTEPGPEKDAGKSRCVRSPGYDVKFSEQIEGLNENTTYYTRAYIVSEVFGTRYGPETSFNTKRTIEVDGFTFKDERDGKVYKAVDIDGMVWMAENLNYATGRDSWCYEDDRLNCEKYGRLYTWDAAMEACPAGWHLATRVEWADLVDAAGGESVAGGKLKATTGWNDYSGNGTDDFGFSAMPGGHRYSYSGYGFQNAGKIGQWWNATETDGSSSEEAWYRRMVSGANYADEDKYGKGSGFSVRCVRDNNNGNTSPAAVSAVAVSEVSYFTAKLSASVTSAGSPGFTERGFCYGTEPTPSKIGSNSQCVRSTGTDVTFSEKIDLKDDNTTYYVRAYVTNESFGTRYGSETSFKTMDIGYIRFTDARDGQVYKAVEIGGKVWMAENLNYNASGSACYNNSQDSCAKYGRLYDWATVMGFASGCNSSICEGQVDSPHRGICPVGWHVPSDAEWSALTDAVGGWETAGTKLKSTGGWNTGSGYKANTNEYGFSALPGGHGYGGGFGHAGYYGFWWSATEFDAGFAWYRDMYYFEYVYRYYYDKAYRFSLRCSQDYVR